MDIDIIDTTSLEANIQGMRHSGFVNRSIIEDIRDIITTGRRAHLRNVRLQQRSENVFSFVVAPAHIGTASAL